LDFTLPNPDNHVEYSIYISSANTRSREFLNEWADVANLLGNKTTFEIHFILWYCVECYKSG